MKILRLRFTNLNSLQGSWEIDFTHSSFASEGIFAITGRTGAGKSTILDAICLALFGQTPRLKAINASINDIMSRHTGECSAEVDFSTHKGSYRASWYQNRARKKIDGALQQPKHTLAELESETFLTEKTTDTVREVEEITGLNFIRFTRSVLLAQGSFAAFLQARDDERSDVLEQLTGTEIYSDISMAVYGQTKEERLKLERLQESVQALRLLSPEERQSLEAQLGDEEKKRNAFQAELERLQGVVSWFKALRQLQEDLIKISAKKETLASEKVAFLPLQKALALAHKALELDAPYTALTSQRLHVAELEKESAVTLASLAEDEKRLASLTEQRGQGEALVSTLRKKHQEERLVHSKVRELDIQLGQQAKNEEAARASLEKSQREAQEAIQNATGLRKQVVTAYETGLALYCRKAVRSPHQVLADGFWPMERLGQKIIELLHEESRAKKELSELLRQTEEAEKNFASAQRQGEASQKELATEQQKLEGLQLGRKTLLAGKNMSLTRIHHDAAQQCLEEIQDALGQTSQTIETAENWHKGQMSVAANKQVVDALSKDIEGVQQQVSDWREELTVLEKASLVAALQEHREHLAQGQPCPLCGALEHPYAQGTSSWQEETETALESGADGEVEKTLSAIKESILQSEGSLTVLQAKQAEERGRGKALLEQQVLNERRFTTQSLALSKSIATLKERGLEDIPVSDFEAWTGDFGGIESFLQIGEQFNNSLRQAYESWLEKRKNFRAVLDEGERLNADMEALSAVIANLRGGCDAKAQGLQEATIAVEGLRGRLSEARQKCSSLEDDVSQKLVEWRELVKPLSQIPRLPENLMVACLDSLPPVPSAPSFLGSEVESVMEGWLQKHQPKMLEALDNVVSLFDGEADNTQGGANGIGPLRVEEVEGWLKQLSSLRERWLELDNEASQNRQNLEAVLPLLAVAEDGVLKAEKIMKEQQALYSAAMAERKKTLHERHVLFGEQRLEAVEQIMKRAEDEAEERLKQTASQENAALGRVGATRRQSEELAVKIQINGQKLSQAENNFKEQLAAHEFPHEEAFKNACLTAQKRKELEEQAQQLANRQIELEAQERETLFQLKEKQQQPPSDESESAVGEKIVFLQSNVRQCGESIGSLRQKLEYNAMQEEQKQGRLAEIERQQLEFGRWETLNSLIGHSEGKKFRRFAQGLTFEAVVSEANKVLARLSERYTLLRDKENPLDLNVCDSDQAGEIRSTRNLSGGESFIVSLALALGLSSMASRTVRLDSLFLDEGFGALDEDSLDVALDVLASLPDDGKVIGIISHVSSLKERIRKSIQVIPMAGGRSRLEEGEGVKRL